MGLSYYFGSQEKKLKIKTNKQNTKDRKWVPLMTVGNNYILSS